MRGLLICKVRGGKVNFWGASWEGSSYLWGKRVKEGSLRYCIHQLSLKKHFAETKVCIVKKSQTDSTMF